MKEKQRNRTGTMLLVVLLSALVVQGCGSSSEETMPVGTGTVLSAATPTAGVSACVNCHTQVAADWLTSRHANVEPVSDLYSLGSPTVGDIAGPGCAVCHDPNGDSGNVTVAGTIGNVARPVVGCETCHGSGSLHANAGGMGPISLLSDGTTGTVLGTGPTVTVSGQFVMCTSCHELLDTAGTGTNAATAHATAVPTGAAYMITDTHFATAGDWSGIGSSGTKTITGYTMDFSGERVCVNCHNPHKTASINREWAQSAHGDTNPFNLNSTSTGYLSGAWTHYNWSNMKSCQRCHTTTTFSDYADALRAGNTELANAIHAGTAVSRIASTTGWKPEMLMCNGCHTNNKGALRNPGAISAKYDYSTGGKTYAKSSYSYPDLAGSNVCMACHTGRESGDTVKGLNDPALLSAGTISNFDYKNMGFINSHYLAAGGQVFSVTGYEFAGRAYNNLSEFRHDKIGTAATRALSPYVDTGSNGPCIGCHMSRPNKSGNHLFMPVSRSTTTYGHITGITSEICFKCHGPSTTLILDLVREQKAQYHEALMAFEALLETRGIYFAPYNPYFFIASGFDPNYNEATAPTHCATLSNLPVKNWQTDGTSTFAWNGTNCVSSADAPGVSGTGQNNLGAAFNFNLLEHDPGGYVHNRMYVKRLIYDSMDWLDDNVMNYSVGAYLDSVCSGGTPPDYCAEATAYLLPNGASGIESERP